MILFDSLRPYTHIVDGIRFPNKPGDNYEITYFSENSSLLEDYPKLNLRLVDVKLNVVPITKIPRTRITPDEIKEFKKLGLISYSSVMKIPTGKNLFYDLSKYLNSIDATFSPSNYRQRLSLFIKNSVNNSFSDYKNFQKVLLYSIDLTKNFNKFVDRKFFPILDQLKDESFGFDHLVLCLITPGGPRYRLFVKDRNFKIQKIITILKTLKPGNNDEVSEIDDENVDELVDKVMVHVDGKINDKNKDKVKDAVKSYIQKDQATKEKIIDNNISSKGMEKVAVASILYKVTGDMNKSRRITNSVAKKKLVKF